MTDTTATSSRLSMRIPTSADGPLWTAMDKGIRHQVGIDLAQLILDTHP